MKILLLFVFCLSAVTALVAQDMATDNARLLSPEEFYISMKSAQFPVIIDTRTWKEYRRDRIHGARLAESSVMLKSIVDSFDLDHPIFIYCDDNQRSSAACSFLRDWGYNHVSELAGGMIAWELASYEVDKEKITRME